MKQPFGAALLPGAILWVWIALVISNCSSGPAGHIPPAAIDAHTNPTLELRSILLLLVDRKSLEPFAMNQALVGDSELREQLALTVASIGDRRGRSLLQVLLEDREPRIRRSAAFGLGVLGDQEASTALLGAVADSDPLVGRAAIGALGRIGVQVSTVIESLIELQGDQLVLRLIPELHRFARTNVDRWAEIGLDRAEVAHDAALLLARRGEGAANRELLRTLLSNDRPEIRRAAAGGLGRIGERTDLEALKQLLDDRDAAPVVGALSSADRLIREGKAAPPEDWVAPLVAMLQDPRPPVRATAIGVAGSWLLDERLGHDLLEVAEDPTSSWYQRELAFASLLRGGDERGSMLLELWASSSEGTHRAMVARVADPDREAALFEDLVEDPVELVRRSAIERWLSKTHVAPRWLDSALFDPDLEIRRAVLEWAVEQPVIAARRLIDAVSDADDRTLLSGIRALRARAQVRDRGETIVVLEHFARHPSFVIRREAHDALKALGAASGSVPAPLGRGGSGKSTATYRDIILQTDRQVRVAVLTEFGAIEVELWCRQLPLTCLSFLQLARQGFYDGLAFDGGEPAAYTTIASEGAGFFVPDERIPVNVERGTLAMVREVADTANGGLLFASTRLPELDGIALPFGKVVSGQSVVDGLIPGLKILSIEVLD